MTVSHVINSTVLIDKKKYVNYIAQGSYDIIETKLLFLTALFL